MKVPFISKTTHIDTEFLNKSLDESTRIYNEIVGSVKSKTLEELYTDEFRTQKTKSLITTVKSLKTGKPVNAELIENMITGLSYSKDHRLNLELVVNKIINLGYKSFGIFVNEGRKGLFSTGRMLSYQTERFAGTQIRLLQATIEHAKRYGIKTMPLFSLLPAVRFHTMMGFRPIKTYDIEVKTEKDIQKSIIKFFRRIGTTELNMDEIIPILSQRKGKYYLDINRTLYCSMMKHNERIAEIKGVQSLKVWDRDAPTHIIW